MKIYLICLTYIFMLYAHSSNAETMLEGKALSNKESIDVISYLKVQIASQYIDIDIATKANLMLAKNITHKKYSGIKDPTIFAKAINKDLLSITHDKHLQLIFAPQGIKQWLSAQPEGSDQLRLIDSTTRNNDNNGFSELNILEGNIGYLNLTAFYAPDIAEETLFKAMNYLSSTKALIIDLRKNTGGSPEMVQLLSSYFFDEKPVHLNTFYIRPSNDYIQTWTLPVIQGKRRPDVDLYILTSRKTFSAAEEFSYNLHNLKRATLIGETTAGGAHAGDFQQLTDRFFVYMPFAKAINPITNTNWEGVGVEPDIKVNAEDALLIAHKKAKEKLAKSQSN